MTALLFALGGVQILMLILLVAVFVFGFGTLLVSRRNARAKGSLAPKPAVKPTAPKAPSINRPAPPTPIRPVDDDDVDAELTDEDLAEIADEAEAAGEVDGDAEVEVEADEPPTADQEPEPLGARPRFRDRLGKARATLAGAMSGVRGRKGITDESWDDLEEALLRADVGVRVTDGLLNGLRARVKSKELTTPDELLEALQSQMKAQLAGSDRALRFEERGDEGPNVWLFVGVNGVGKTTTIGKVGAVQMAEGRRVLMAAGDTFRAAAAEQLQTWAGRSNSEFVRGNEGGDPSSVIFDGVQAAKARGCNLVLGDTAGRLHNKSNLMEELRKVRRVADRDPGKVTEVLLVLDATTGQNGLAQAREFAAATEVTGVVLTKLDGSAKGGIVFAIETEFGIPVKLVGLGETIADLVPFDPDEFVDALFAE